MAVIVVTSDSQGHKLVAPINKETEFQKSARTGKPNKAAMKKGPGLKGGGK